MKGDINGITKKVASKIIFWVGLFGVSFINMPVIPFIIIIFVELICFFVYVVKICKTNKTIKIEEKKLKEIRNIILELDSNNNENEIEYQKDRYHRKINHVKKYKKKFRKKLAKATATFIVIAIFCVSNLEHVNTFTKEITEVNKNASKDEQNVDINILTSLDIEIPKTDEEDKSKNSHNISTQNETQKNEDLEDILLDDENDKNQIENNSKNDWVRFRLEYPNGYPGIQDDDFNELYDLVFYTNMDNLDEKIMSDIIIWENSCTVNTPLDTATTSSGKSTKYYVNIEESFSNTNNTLLSSDLLDEVINGREELFELYPNGSLAWILANHKQTYALNYLEQTNDEKSILYFYMSSIRDTQKSLEFEMSKETKAERINYLQSRYKDIAECKTINGDTRLKAYEIYTSMQDALNELQISQP